MPKGVGRGYSLNVYIRPDQDWIRKALEETAKGENRSLSEIVMRVLEHHVVAAKGPTARFAAGKAPEIGPGQ